MLKKSFESISVDTDLLHPKSRGKLLHIQALNISKVGMEEWDEEVAYEAFGMLNSFM